MHGKSNRFTLKIETSIIMCLTIGHWGQLHYGVQRDFDIRKLLCGDIEEVGQDAAHHSLQGRER